VLAEILFWDGEECFWACFMAVLAVWAWIEPVLAWGFSVPGPERPNQPRFGLLFSRIRLILGLFSQTGAGSR
jgi:hypothetical protein